MDKNQRILDEISEEFIKFPQTEALGLGGSRSANTSDVLSDIDVYVFINKPVPLDKRNEIIKKYSSKYETGCEYFGAGDEFLIDEIDKQLDVMYFDMLRFKEEFNNVWNLYMPKNGYTTCFLYTLKNLDIKYDKSGQLKFMRDKLKKYPGKLKENIIKRNMMLLYDKPFASYFEQIEKAIKRNDINSVNHRTAAFLASYFDIVFAKNELLHPGEKRLVKYALKNCKILPCGFRKDVDDMASGKIETKLQTAEKMIENLRKIL